jgi:hypothetical protein
VIGGSKPRNNSMESEKTNHGAMSGEYLRSDSNGQQLFNWELRDKLLKDGSQLSR